MRLLADLDEVERSVANSKVPSGKIRVSANLPVGRLLLLPIVPTFLDAYPKLSLEISLTDQVIDLIEQRTDVRTAQRPAQNLPASCAEAWRCADGDRRIAGLSCATRRSEDT
ncbi:LysR substrate-binding domain-containing protein [Bradyrhizobium erythrophlei]|uniref:LysR substrate-binding domain-containing protein n=1 Tax=Bradyrhizobium erythrophlei TaxID=1437360 RepID=UPI000B8911B5|nr:LysR substrate-binding domain-containing protein [Bradyrhizobium erythrophlei]